MRSLHKYLVTAHLATLMSVGCGPTQHNLKTQKTKVKTLEKAVRKAKAMNRAMKLYGSNLKGERGRWVAFSARELERSMTAYMPYKFRGQDMSKKRLKGQIWFEKPKRLTLLPGNRLSYRMAFKARNIKVNLKGVFGAGRRDETKIKTALEGGGTIDLDVHLRLGNRNTEVWMTTTVKAVQLNKHNTSRHRKFLKDALSGKFFGYPLRLKIPAGLATQQPRLVTTKNHLVVVLGRSLE
ncbi:MAG: hypothetical protein VYA30_00975 [Myxococcota bacterium]|nr:hypothetical protein [Myxococcota bacterium]